MLIGNQVPDFIVATATNAKEDNMREIETKRLFLRKLRSDDAESIFRNWASDSEVAKYVTWNVHKDINETKAILDMWLAEYDNDNCYRYGIENKADGELIGMIDVVGYYHENPVIGYCCLLYTSPSPRDS